MVTTRSMPRWGKDVPTRKGPVAGWVVFQPTTAVSLKIIFSVNGVAWCSTSSGSTSGSIWTMTQMSDVPRTNWPSNQVGVIWKEA
jgi:hypothetical protein